VGFWRNARKRTISPSKRKRGVEADLFWGNSATNQTTERVGGCLGEGKSSKTKTDGSLCGGAEQHYDILCRIAQRRPRRTEQPLRGPVESSCGRGN